MAQSLDLGSSGPFRKLTLGRKLWCVAMLGWAVLGGVSCRNVQANHSIQRLNLHWLHAG